MKIKVVIKNFKKLKTIKNYNSKIYLGISLGLLRAVCDQFSFRQFLVLSYTSQGLQVPSNVASANYRVLICCTCHFQSCSLVFVYFGFLCLQVSSLSNFHPDTSGRRWSFIQAHLFNCASGREQHCKQISLACVGSARSVWATLGLPPLTTCALSWSTLLRLQVALPGNCLRQALGCTHFPDVRRSGSGSWVLHKSTDLVGPAFCALPRSEQLRRTGAWQVHSSWLGGVFYHLPSPSRSIS